MSNPYFRFRQFTVYHDRCAMKVGTDGTLLGAWARGGERILDIGTGTGLVALMMAQRYPQAMVTGVDIDADACQQACENAAASPFSQRVDIVCGDVCRLSPADYQSFDAIVSNPPYFQNSLKNPDGQRSLARHNDMLTYEQLFKAVSLLLSANGEFSLIIPSDCRQSVKEAAALYAFFPTRECGVKTIHKKQIRRYLLSFSRHSVEQIEKTIGIIEDAPNVRSEWYSQLTADFYL